MSAFHGAEVIPAKPKVVWRPLPGSQALAMCAPCNFILFEGTRGPGKTDAQLMRFRRNVGRGYGRFWRGIIFDRQYKNLDDLVQKSMRWFPQFGDGAQWKGGGSDFKWVWPTGEELLFRQISKLSDYWNYHGHEYPYIGWNELTKYPTSELLDMMMSCNRSSFVSMLHSPINEETGQMDVLPPIPLEVFATTNPYGIGHNWVNNEFIEPAPPGVPIIKEIEVFNPRTQQRETIQRSQVRIFGSYKENIYLDPLYISQLETMSDDNKRRAWLHGDWDVTAGGALDDLYRSAVHRKPRFKIPAQWRIFRAMDWGSSRPFAIGWYAVANGEEVLLPNGEKFAPARGSVVKFHEWYGTKKIGTNLGLRMSSRDVAKGVVLRDAALLKEGWVKTKVKPGPADNSISSVNDAESDSIEKLMIKEGCTWTSSDKSPGSRKNGLELFRTRLENSARGEGPGFYIMDHLEATIKTTMTVPRDDVDPDDVDTEAEDHMYDTDRYAILSLGAVGSVKLTMQTPT